MPVSYFTTLYDSAALGTTANTEFTLFKVARGADSTHVEAFTNMRGAGALPAKETFVVWGYGITLDSVILEADINGWFAGGFVDVRINDQTRFYSPIQPLVDHIGFGGSDNQTAGATTNHVGLLGFGFMYPDPSLRLTIPPAENFYVRLFQKTAISSSTLTVKVILYGVLTIPAVGE